MPDSTSLVGFIAAALLARGPIKSVEASDRRSSHRLFTDGVVVSVLNPKITDGSYAVLAAGLRQPPGWRVMQGPLPRCMPAVFCT